MELKRSRSMKSALAIRSAMQALVLVALTLPTAGPAFAQAQTQQMPMTGMPGHSATMGRASATPAGAADAGPLIKSMDTMNKAMAAAPMTGNTDQDFVAMMIPHHQGAIDMAKVELATGKDPFLRKLARNIIEAQQREIGEMTA